MLKSYAAQADVPEALRASAVETKAGTWIVEEDVPDVTKLMGAIEAERERAKTAEKAAKDAKHALDELKRTADARAQGVSEEALQKIRDAEALARKPIEDERDSLRVETRKLRLTDKVRALYLANGGMPDRVDDAMDQLDKRTDLGDEGGIVYKGKDGKLTADNTEAFFTKFKVEKPWLFSGAGGSGSGAEGAGGGGEAVVTHDPELVANRRRDIAGAF
jgi:hypothetical protein